MMRGAQLHALAAGCIHNGGAEMCERVEQAALVAIKRAEWARARRLLRLRMKMPHELHEKRPALERLLRLVAEAEA